jgi:lipid-A-disaccharide synthase
MPRLYFVAGEDSGDIHGANLINALQEQAPDIQCAGLGGTRMRDVGMRLDYDLAGESIMGFVEVVRHFPRIRRLFLDTVQRLRDNPPDAVVLIDYPGFNIRLAKEIHALGIPVIYYISPQVWAWKKKRIHQIAATVTKMLVIFPFEEKLYQDLGVDCAFVGHPLLDHIAQYTPDRTFDGDPVIGILPGSRKQEIQRILPDMIAVARGLQEEWPDAVFVTPCVSESRAEDIRALAGDFPLQVVPGAMYDVLSSARFALVASGTATVETTLFGLPFVILYRVKPVTYWLARALVNIEHIGMVNILAGRRIVPEFVQHDAAARKVLPVAHDLVAESDARATMLRDLQTVRDHLGGPGASARAAQEIMGAIRGA